jgi:hypothetical protein
LAGQGRERSRRNLSETELLDSRIVLGQQIHKHCLLGRPFAQATPLHRRKHRLEVQRRNRATRVMTYKLSEGSK